MHVIFRVRMHLTFRVCMHVTFRDITVLPCQRLLVLKQCQRNIHNQSTEPTESGDDPRVPNYPRISIAPSAQNTALHGTITKYPMESSYN